MKHDTQWLRQRREGNARGLNRRELLLAMLGASAAATLGSSAYALDGPGPMERIVSAQGDSDEHFGLGWLAGGGEPVAALTGFRGHAVIQHPRRRNSVLVFARRPGTQAVEIDLQSGEQVGGFSCNDQRHLFGHGCFSHDGSVLFVTEGDLVSGAGRISVRDGASYALLEDYASHGIGPHDLRLLPDGNLVVANGGLLTRPESGRRVLNAESMLSTLAYVSTANGALLEEYVVPEPKASIRHLDVAVDGTVALAMQMQREAAGHHRVVPLAGSHRRGDATVTLFDPDDAVTTQLRDYLGSVAIASRHQVAGFTSPRGNLAVFWNLQTGDLAGYHALRDVCGLAYSQSRDVFILSNSFGELRELDAANLTERRDRRRKYAGFRWDNHMLVTV